MSRRKLRTEQTELDNLVSNLRGEVGEIITTWVLFAILRDQIQKESTNDIAKDMHNVNLSALHMIYDKLKNEIIAKLSELAQKKIGRINFYFASVKLGILSKEIESYSAYIKSHHITRKRNYDISHRELPWKWSEHRLIHIPNHHVLRATAIALALMKKIDRHVLGPSSPYLWKEMRKKRYDLTMSGHIAYMLLPHMGLPQDARMKIIKEELAQGKQVWTQMNTLVNGRPARIQASKEWGVIDLTSIEYMDEKT
jgi:hypothetical protein